MVLLSSPPSHRSRRDRRGRRATMVIVLAEAAEEAPATMTSRREAEGPGAADAQGGVGGGEGRSPRGDEGLLATALER